LLQRGGEADLDEFMGSIAINWGIRRRTQEEYIEDLKNAGAIRARTLGGRAFSKEAATTTMPITSILKNLSILGLHRVKKEIASYNYIFLRIIICC